VLLGVSVLALGTAALRAAAPLAEAGLARVLVAATFGVSAAVCEALLLGLVGLGGSTAALVLAALATWALTRAMLPAPVVPGGSELAAWWSGCSRAARAGFGALAGAAVAWIIWQLVHPAIGFDSVHYHLPEIVIWVQRGHPGSIEPLVPGLPVGNYPLTAEVSVEWSMAIARSFVPFVLWPWATLALTAVAGFAGLRALRVSRLGAALAVAALCTNLWLLAWQSNGSLTDPPALAWLVTCAGLCALALKRPSLLAVAVVAGGLSVGCKTTTVPLVLVSLALGGWAVRASLRTLAPALGLALIAALAVGGVWYVRNLITHGSPFWPIVATPWGDAVPPAVRAVHTSFLDHPRTTIAGLGHQYLRRFGGSLLLLLGAILVAIAVPRRRVVTAAGVVAATALVWASSPVTGLPTAPGMQETIFSTTRYLLPVLAAAVTVLALASGTRIQSGRLALLILAIAAIVNLVQTLQLPFPDAPAAATPLLGALAGAIAARSADVVRAPGVRDRGIVSQAVATLVAAGLGALLAIPARGFVARHGLSGGLLTSGVVAHLADLPGGGPVATTPAFIAPLAGDDLRHRLDDVPYGDGCRRVQALARTDWIVVARDRSATVPLGHVARCLTGWRPFYEDRVYVAYAPLGRSSTTSGPGISPRTLAATAVGVSRVGRAAR